MKSTNLKTIARFACAAILLAVSVLSVRATTNYSSTVLSYGPVAYWRFTDTNSGPALNIVTNYGSVGAVANAYEVGPDVTNAVPGVIGTAIQFWDPFAASPDDLDGYETLSVATKIDVPYSAGINPAPPFSIEFWQNPNTLSSDPNGDCVISCMDTIGNSQADRAGYLFYLGSGGGLQWRLGNSAGYAGIVQTTNNFATVGSWQHVAATWDGTNAIIYVNGVVCAAQAVSAANWTQNTEAFMRFGASALSGYGYVPFETADGNAGSRGYDGYLEQVAVYTNILSPATVLAHYQSAATNISAAAYFKLITNGLPVAYWPMQEPAVTVPDPTTYPTVQNFGYDGDAAEGTNQWGSIQGQPGPGYAGFGTASNAFFFDGVNGYVEIGADPGLVFPTDPDEKYGPGNSTVTNQITMMAWVKPVADDYYRVIMEQGFDESDWDGETFLRISDGPGSGTAGVHYYEVGMVDGYNDFEDVVLAPIPPGDIGNWVFLCGTFDGTNWNLYRDGQPVGTPHSYTLVLDVSQEFYDVDEVPTPQGTGPITVNENWTIGSRADDPNLFYTYLPDVVNCGMLFDGYIAEPAIFTNGLTPAQVYAVYASAQVPPVITTGLTNPGTIYLGSSVSFSIGADGVTNIGYLWESNGISTGDTTTNYVFTPATIGTYTISVVVTNQYGTNTPSVTVNVLNAPPVITTQPTEQKRFVGFPFSFSVAATGTTPFTYYWKLGSTVVQAGSSPTYSGTASLANAGVYSVIVSNSSGINAVSSNAPLVVYPIPGEFAGQVLSNFPPPIAYYRLDETNGTVAYDYINGNNGTYFNTTLGVSGYSAVDPDNLAAEFNGTNSYVGNISGTAINFAGTNSSFTLEAWVNAQPGQADQATIIAKGIGNNGTQETEQFALDVFENRYRFFTVSARNGSTPSEAQATAGPNGFWQHVVGVYDAQGQTLSIYVNGVLQGQAPYTDAINGTTSPISIGSKRLGNDPAYNGTFNGSIDNVCIYATKLTGPQILADYNSAYGTALSPSITIQPVGVTNFAGITTVLSVTAIGSPTLTYQWYQNGTAVPGATYASLTNTPSTYAEAGTYYVSVANEISSTNSVSVPLVVLAPPTNPPIIPGLVMHLTFDTNLSDSTGRGNNGTGEHTTLNPSLINTNLNSAANGTNAVTVVALPDPSGGMTNSSFYYEPGVVGGALHYSTQATKYSGGPNSGAGIGTNDYYVNIGYKPDLQFGTNDFSVAYWIRLPYQNWNPGIPGDNGPFEGGDLPFFTDALLSTGGNGYVFAPAYGYGTVDPENGGSTSVTPPYPGGWATSMYGNGAGLRYYGNFYTGLINDGNWHSLIHVISRSKDSLVTYLDGAVASYDKVDGTDLATAGNLNVSNNACVGQDPTGFYGETCEADIDDLAVWKRAITPLEAGAIYVAAVSNQLTFTSPVTLTLYPTNTTQFAITWPVGVAGSSNYLQAASNPLGAFTNVTGATSPYVFSPSGSQKYFRIAQTNVYVIP